jgi:UDP-N-acetylmuramoyl-L-alanyl-D-glutamate--2,6-diaminopimelate ligase
MDRILEKIKKIIPKSVFRLFQPVYHFFLALTGNIAYRFPGYKMTVIGVTGTNGKSTCVEIITEVLKTTGKKVGMISTVDIEIAGERRVNKVGRTTIGRWGTHKLMREMAKRGCKYAVIEVASEGIAWYRIWGIPFDGAVFTCLAPEHLNYHKTMENYRNTKGKLFKKLSSPFNFKKTKRISVVNADDKEAKYFHDFKADKKYLFSIDSQSESGMTKGAGNDKLVKAKNIELKSDGTEFDIVNEDKNYQVKTKALGEFNVLNELAAYCIGLGYDAEPGKMIKVFEDFGGTRGRAERIDEGQDFDVIVDYAVTPDAQGFLYKSLREITSGKLISIFGATGDRDKTKRPGMGRVASELTDIVILTDDETYTEDSKKIIDEVYAGVSDKTKDKVKIIPDRLEAIKKAISLAKRGDTVIITGIGHQKSRNMGGKKIEWDERQIISDLLKKGKNEN